MKNYQVNNLPKGCIKKAKVHNPFNGGSQAVMQSDLKGFTHVMVSNCDYLVPIDELELHSNQITYKGGLGYRIDHPMLDKKTWGYITHLLEMK